MNSKQLVVDIAVGTLSGLMRVISAIATATLLFPPSMSKYFFTGVSICVLTVVAPNFIAALANRIPYITWSRDYTPIFLFSVVGVHLFDTLPAGQFAHAMIAFIMATSVVTGVTFYLVGRFRLTNRVRYVPFPVVAGFMAGIALLIVQRGLGDLAGISVTPAHAARLMTPAVMLHWIPGIVIALAMLGGVRVISWKYFRHIVIFGAIAIFLLVLWATHTPISHAYAAGWAAPAIHVRLPFEIYFAHIWHPAAVFALASHMDILLTTVAVSLLSILITLAGLEDATNAGPAFERELQNAGIANVASGLLGGAIAHQSTRSSMENYRMGGRTRLVPFMTAAVGFVFLAFGWGTGAIGYLPAALLYGLVIYIGLDGVWTWLVASRRRMTKIEYYLLAAIAIATLVWGVLVGIIISIVVAVLLFTINYSRLRCIEIRQTGRSLRSKVERPGTEDAILRRYDDELRLFRLQGYLFFASGETISETVTTAMHHHRANPRVPLCIMLDFGSVSGIDTSATFAFSRILATSRRLGITIMFIRMNEQVAGVMARSIVGFDTTNAYSEIEVALEVRETSILRTFEAEVPAKYSATDTLRQFLPTNEDVKSLSAFFDVQEVYKGETLFVAGEPANSMMIVDSGEFEVYREAENGKLIHLRKVKAGAILGEMGIYLRGRRTASVRATLDSRVLVLDDTGLGLMHEMAPDLALKFNRFIIGVLAERLSHSNNEVLELASRT